MLHPSLYSQRTEAELFNCIDIFKIILKTSLGIIALVNGGKGVAVLTTNLVSIWFVISALLSMVVSKFTGNIWIQFGIFVIVGVALIPLSKKIYSKIKVGNISTNFDRIIGMKGIVTEDITKDNIGEVKVDGKCWSAYSDTNIKKGETVK